MEFSDLTGYRSRLEGLLRAQYAQARRATAPALRGSVDALSEFTLRGGKRFRALLVLGGYWIASGASPEAALPAAAALEHFQTWMLVHDDIIDHSEERRGGPTLHRSLAGAHAAAGRLGDAEATGTGLAITLGDLEEPFTLDALLSVRVPQARRLAAAAEYVAMTRATAYGQLLDIQNGSLPVEEVREADVLKVHELKSAVYTVSSPLRIGALLGGARPALTSDLEAIGLDLGIAFQLRDDVLGAGLGDGDPGKSANDLVEGKRTLLVVRAWAKGSATDRAALRAVLGVATAAPGDVAQAVEVLRSTGSAAYSEARIAQLTKRAYARLEASRAVPARAKPLLREIGDRLVRRST